MGGGGPPSPSRDPAFMLTDSIMIGLVMIKALMFTDLVIISLDPIQPPHLAPICPRSRPRLSCAVDNRPPISCALYLSCEGVSFGKTSGRA